MRACVRGRVHVIVSQMPKMEHGVPLLRMPPPPPPPTTCHCHLPASTTTQYNWTALHLASYNGHAGVVGLLLGTPLMTEDCLNAKDKVSGGWWWGAVGAVVWAFGDGGAGAGGGGSGVGDEWVSG